MSMDDEGDDEAEVPAPQPVLERALLWAIRAWVIGLTRRVPVEERIEAMLARLGAPEASSALFALMWVLNCGATRTLAIDCVCHPGVSGDERRLLEVLALYQQAREFEALLLLRSILTPAAAIAAGANAAQLASLLAAAGCMLRLAPSHTGRYALVAEAGSTVH